MTAPFCVFRELENDLLLIATYFIEEDKELRTASGIHRSESARRKRVRMLVAVHMLYFQAARERVERLFESPCVIVVVVIITVVVEDRTFS